MRNAFCFSLVVSGLLALTLCARPVAAGSLSGVDAMTSTIIQHDQSSFSGLGARVRLAPVAGLPGFEVLPGLEYWRNTSTVQIYDIRAERRDATLAADVRYRVTTHGWSPYLGAGFGIHFLSSEVHAPLLGVPSESHSIIKGGLAVLGGLSFPLAGAFESFLEAKYHGVSSYEQLKLSWGLAYNIP